jgi:hypothetical protein
MSRNVLIECEKLAARLPARLPDDARQSEVIGADALQLGMVNNLTKPLDRKQVAEPVNRSPGTCALQFCSFRVMPGKLFYL